MELTIHAHGAAIPARGFGTWRLTGEACVAAVAAALDCGYRHIDTARVYDNEREVGAALAASGLARDAVFVTTKVWFEDLAAGALERSAEGSLKRLGLSAVDLLLVHWPNPAIALKETIGALCRTRESGLARHIGVSNFPVPLLEEAVAHARAPLVCNQCEYHPWLDQSAVIAACARHGMAFTAYSPLGKGDLVQAAPIRAIAERIGRTPAQVVLRWHLQQGVVAIPRSGTRAHIAENFRIDDFALSDADMAAIFALRRPDGRLVDPGWAPRWDRQ